jgi:hypothetical protein
MHRRTIGWILMKISLDIKPLEAAPISKFYIAMMASKDQYSFVKSSGN